MVKNLLMMGLLLAGPLSCTKQQPNEAPTSDKAERRCVCDESFESSEEYEREIYLLGARLGELAQRQYVPRVFRSETEVEILAKGLRDGAAGKTELGSALYDFDQPRLLVLQQSWREKQREREGAYFAEAGKQPGAVLLETGVVFVSARKGSRDLPVDEAGNFAVRLRILRRNGKVVNSQPPERMSRLTIGDKPTWYRQAVERMRIGGQGRLFFAPGVLNSVGPEVAEWEAGVVELEVLEGIELK